VPSLNHYNRTQLCWDEHVTLSIFNLQGELIGTDVLVFTQSMQLEVTSLKFDETITLVSVTPSGTVPANLTMSLAVMCGSLCTITNKFPQNSPIEPGVVGTLAYSIGVGTSAVNETNTQYTLNIAGPNYTQINPAVWRTPIDYRCDNMVSNQRAGCVFPAFFPTLTTMAKLSDIAANIKRIQTNGPLHYGRPGGPSPLYHLTNVAQQKKNRAAVCGKKVVGPPPPGKECDEYPFASTYQGGTAVSKPNRGTAWVPAAQQRSQGGLLSAFWKAFRVLDQDAFYVKV
jgi:hypothetical protein